MKYIWDKPIYSILLHILVLQFHNIQLIQVHVSSHTSHNVHPVHLDIFNVNTVGIYQLH